MNQMIQTEEEARCFSARRLIPSDMEALSNLDGFSGYAGMTEAQIADSLQAGQGWCGLMPDGTVGAAAILMPLRTKTPLAESMRWLGLGAGGTGGVLLPLYLHPDYSDVHRFLRLCVAELSALYRAGRAWAVLPYEAAAQNLTELYLSERLVLCGLHTLCGTKSLLFQARQLSPADLPVMRVPFEDERRLRFYLSAGAVADSFGWHAGHPQLCLRSGT